MEEKISFKVEYKGKTYSFDYGCEAYIFHTGIYNEMDTKYDEQTLLKYVDFVRELYLYDSNRTPLGHLGDYVAENWESVQKERSRANILDMFYLDGGCCI